MVVALVSVAIPTSASASVADCTGGANGFVEHSDEDWGANHGTVSWENDARVTLEVIRNGVFGNQYGFAALRGQYSGGYRVWMDWTWNNRQDWIQCGPFNGETHNNNVTTSMKATSAKVEYKFRACGDQGAGRGGMKCTDWW